jgi:hypothetical protein
MEMKMSDTKENKRPTHIIWLVIGDEPKSHWTRIGAAWPNRDGKGLKLVFNAYPTTGRIMLREAEQAEGGQQ